MKKISKQTVNRPIIVQNKIGEINLIKINDIFGVGKIVKFIADLIFKDR